ncbi:hypothetical protein AB7M63_006776 [Bradyrhizobium japonicum]
MEPRITKIGFKPIGRRWIAARIGMTLPELFSLGLRAKDVCAKLPHDWLVFDPKVSETDVSAAYNGWRSTQRKVAALAGHERRRSGKGPRPCMCCKKTFKSEGSHNRICRYCTGRAAATYDPW